MKCESCGEELVAKRKSARYCSNACRQKVKRHAKKNDTLILPKSDTLTQTSLKPPSHIPDVPVEEPYDREANLAAFKKMGLDEVTWLTTGILAFDALTMIPRGRTTQIQGPFAVGKTTLCLNMVRGMKDHRVLYIDSEATLNPALLVALGLEAKNFTLYNKSAFIEDIAEEIIAAAKSGKYELIIFDSLAACTFRSEVEGEIIASNIGQKAKIMNKLMRIVPMELKRTQTALVIINQEREYIGGYVPQKYTPGGMAVPYGASLMVALKTTKGARFPKTGPPYTGHEVTAEIIKSKVNDPWRKATFKLYYGMPDEATSNGAASND